MARVRLPSIDSSHIKTQQQHFEYPRPDVEPNVTLLINNYVAGKLMRGMIAEKDIREVRRY